MYIAIYTHGFTEVCSEDHENMSSALMYPTTDYQARLETEVLYRDSNGVQEYIRVQPPKF